MMKLSCRVIYFSVVMPGLLFACASIGFAQANSTTSESRTPAEGELLSTEKLSGESVWTSSLSGRASRDSGKFVVKVWFDRQFLGDGAAYRRRATEFSGASRTELRSKVIATLKKISEESYADAKAEIQELIDDGSIDSLERHWIVNGITCATDLTGLEALQSVPGVKKIFVTNQRSSTPRAKNYPAQAQEFPPQPKSPFDPKQYKHPWYIHALNADRVWSEFGVTGKGTLNVIHDFNFVYPEHLGRNVYRNPGEIPGNGKDDDQNGYIDDCCGYNFATDSSLLTPRPNPKTPPDLHGTMCAAIICARGTQESPYEFGIAPEGQWAGVIAAANIESAIEWAIEHKADTYSMSFSRPNLGELRSHWRKIMEHGSFCGVFFVSGAGNFAQTVKTPVQMRTPEDIPDVVFAAAGVQRDLSRTVFSSQGPVLLEDGALPGRPSPKTGSLRIQSRAAITAARWFRAARRH